MKKILCILAIFAVLVQTSSRMFVYVQWLENQEFIVKNTCENRNKPELKCHGKCKLMQAMAAIEKQEQGDENQSKKGSSSFFDEVFFTSNVNFLPHFAFQYFPVQENTKPLFSYFPFLKDAFLASVWHPPTV